MINNTFIINGVIIIMTLFYLFIFIEDMKTRTIRLYALIGFYLFGIIYSLSQYKTFHSLIINSFWNICFILGQIIIVWLYIFIKYKSSVKQLNRWIGEGDILFWLVITPIFPVHQFIIHFIGSLIAALILHQLFKYISGYNKEYIPLAGMQSLYLASVLIVSIYIKI